MKSSPAAATLLNKTSTYETFYLTLLCINYYLFVRTNNPFGHREGF